MPRKKKFGEESVITSFRVPKSKKDKIREKVNKLIEKETNGIEKEVYNEFVIEKNEVKYQPKVETIEKSEIKIKNLSNDLCPYCKSKIEIHWTYCLSCNKPLVPELYTSHPIKEKKIKEKVETEKERKDKDKMTKKEIYEEFKDFIDKDNKNFKEFIKNEQHG